MSNWEPNKHLPVITFREIKHLHTFTAGRRENDHSFIHADTEHKKSGENEAKKMVNQYIQVTLLVLLRHGFAEWRDSERCVNGVREWWSSLRKRATSKLNNRISLDQTAIGARLATVQHTRHRLRTIHFLYGHTHR